jgi:hypothetical protein
MTRHKTAAIPCAPRDSQSARWKSRGDPGRTPRSTACRSAPDGPPQLPFALHWSAVFNRDHPDHGSWENGSSRGNTPPREVFPLDWPASRLHPGQLTRLERGERIRQPPCRRAGCSPSSPGGALCRQLVEPPPERSPRATPWRERPPDMAGWPAKPAASDALRAKLSAPSTTKH